MSRALRASFLLASLAASACTAPDPCRDLGAHQALVITLLFGRTAAADATWSDFLHNVITPRFPDGLTVLDGSGQWRDPRTGWINSEPSRVVIIATQDATGAGRKLADIAEEYKARFQEQSVGVLAAPTCAAF